MIRAALALILAAAPAMAQEGPFAAGSQAESWGLAGEESARFEATVVDLLCEIAGDCPADCGAGARQLGLRRAADGALVVVAKNGQPLFNGAVDDLLPWCGQQVEVDGLLVGDDPANAFRIYQIQFIRRLGAAEWSKADRWLDAWKARNPSVADAPGEWFRNDPRVQAQIERRGWLGLGAETDAAFLKEWFN
jgi:hypothetical protein